MISTVMLAMIKADVFYRIKILRDRRDLINIYSNYTFTGWKSEAQRVEVTCPKSYRANDRAGAMSPVF